MLVEKLVIPLIVGGAGFVLGMFDDEIRDRLFPPVTSATISDIELERGVRLDEYLKSTGRSGDDFSTRDLGPRHLRRIGIVVSVDITTTGYKQDALALNGRVIDAATGAAVSRPLTVFEIFQPMRTRHRSRPRSGPQTHAGRAATPSL